MKYNEYINGSEWLEKSSRYLEMYPICELCHKFPSTQVHHTSYARIGEELRKDLMGVCDRCHTHLHLLPPMIKDETRLKKANKLIRDFIKHPEIKTIALNELMLKYYPGKIYMKELAEEACPETAFFMQNVMEILDADSKNLKVDLIEELTRIVYMLKVQAAKNAKKKKEDEKIRKEKFENGEFDYLYDIAEQSKAEKIKESTLDEILENRRKNFCLNELSSKPILGEAMRWANNEYFNGQMFFKRSGIDTPVKFYLCLHEKGVTEELFTHLGGKPKDLVGELNV